MPEHFISLSPADQRDALLQASSTLGRPAFVLEKDLWVVWALGKLFSNCAGDHLTFKGGTSLSKVHRLIDRFSEDIDLTYDIRQILPQAESETPPNASQARKWSNAAREALPGWITQTVMPLLNSALAEENIEAQLIQDKDKVYLHYPTRTQTHNYVEPRVMLEFGARSTGEPHARHSITCDMAMAEGLEGLAFPVANPIVMDVARTFWEKATAAHVYCVQQRLRGERFARHWHDLIAIAQNQSFSNVTDRRDIAECVAEHKSWFFAERAADGNHVDYRHAVNGNLRLVPTGDALTSLADDYEQMLAGGMFEITPLPFGKLMAACADLEARMNAAAPIPTA